MKWEFSPPQLEAIKHSRDTLHQIFLSVGSVRSGKTYSASLAFFLYTQALPRPYLHIIASQNLHVLEAEVLGGLQDLADSLGVKHEFKRVNRTWTCGTQSYLVLAGHDRKSQGRIMGLTVHSALLDEATLVPEPFWRGIMTRLSYDESKMWASCNPQGPKHWLKTEWIDKGLVRPVTFTMDDNPTLGEEVKRRNRSRFTGAFYGRMIEGKWTANEGLIWPTWRTAVPEGEIIRRDIGLDYGIQTVTAAVWLDSYRDGGINVSQEWGYHWKDGEAITDDEIVDAVSERIDGPVFIHIDPSASSLISAWRRRGKGRVRLADNRVLPGIKTVSNMLVAGTLTISPDVVELRGELASYHWDLEKDDTPVKEDDHFCDGLRYGTMGAVRVAGRPLDLPAGL